MEWNRFRIDWGVLRRSSLQSQLILISGFGSRVSGFGFRDPLAKEPVLLEDGIKMSLREPDSLSRANGA